MGGSERVSTVAHSYAVVNLQNGVAAQATWQFFRGVAYRHISGDFVSGFLGVFYRNRTICPGSQVTSGRRLSWILWLQAG